MAPIKFVRNHDDLSTDRGYQFKFYCDKYGAHVGRGKFCPECGGKMSAG